MIYYNTAMILCTPIPKAIKTHKIVQSYALKDVPRNNFFSLSNEKELHLVQWLYIASSHNENEIDDNTCCHGLESYNQSKGRLKFLFCQKWFYDECFTFNRWWFNLCFFIAMLSRLYRWFIYNIISFSISFSRSAFNICKNFGTKNIATIDKL